MRACTSCGSENTRTCRHKNARIVCLDCDFVIRNEGSEIINKPVKPMEDIAWCNYELYYHCHNCDNTETDIFDRCQKCGEAQMLQQKRTKKE